METNVVNFARKVSREELTDEDVKGLVTEALAVETAEEINVRMEIEGVSRAELARRLKTSRANVTQMLGGPSNMTLETLAKIGMALNCEVLVRLVPVEQRQASSNDY